MLCFATWKVYKTDQTLRERETNGMYTLMFMGISCQFCCESCL